MSTSTFSRIAGSSRLWGAMAFCAALTLAGIGAAWHIETQGHYVTGMSNAVPWGLPLVLATLCIVAASGALNVASVASVFGKEAYKPASRLSCLLALALLGGGLFTLLIDLGRPEEVFLALTRFNFTSVFSINIIIYSGFFLIVGLYGLMMLVAPHQARPLGVASFLWRLLMTTGTGAVFGVLVGRGGMHSAIMPPLFIALSLSLGMAAFILTLAALEYTGRRTAGLDALAPRLRSLLAVLVAVAFYMVLALHLIGIASPSLRGFEAFVLCTGGVYPLALWGGFVLLGTALPLVLLLMPACRHSRMCLLVAAASVLLGGLAVLYVLIIAPQAFPPDIFPGKVVRDSLYALPAVYTPTLGEWTLGLTGIGVAGLMVLLGTRFLPLLPESQDKL